jgi:hypothetical protein
MEIDKKTLKKLTENVMHPYNSGLNEIMFNIEAYKNCYHELIDFIKEENEAIKFFNFDVIKKLEEHKQILFQSFIDFLNKILSHAEYKMLSTEIKDFIKDSYNHVDKEMSQNLQNLKIEASLLNCFFQGIKQSSQTQSVTYGVYNKFKKKLPSSLTFREI